MFLINLGRFVSVIYLERGGVWYIHLVPTRGRGPGEYITYPLGTGK